MRSRFRAMTRAAHAAVICLPLFASANAIAQTTNPNPMDSIRRLPGYRPALDTTRLLSPASIARYAPRLEREWLAYVWRSRDRYTRDTSAMPRELRAAGLAAMTRGFLFVDSRLKKERPQMAPNSVTLGRPWHPFANPRAVGSVAFIDCWMDDHIGERGWDRMSSVDSTGTRIWYEPSSARFFEYGTEGGAVTAHRSFRYTFQRNVEPSRARNG